MVSHGEGGFSLIEASIAVSVLAVGVAGLAQLALLTGRSSIVSQRATVAQQAARERMEQLRSLAWSSDGPVPVTDWSSNLTTTPPSSAGAGLGPATDAVLRTNTAGYCDFIDAAGRWLSAGPTVPRGAAWVRRWSIRTMDTLPDTLLLQVVVVAAPGSASGSDGQLSAARAANGAWLATMHTRRAR
jgi:Tfp pilus assembly protein PilV